MRAMPRFDQFGVIAPFTERMVLPPLPGPLLELLVLAPGMDVLDAGGGTARVATVAAHAGARLTVADLTQAAAHKAARSRAAGERLPFPDASFDRVLMVDALHRIRNQQQAVKELFRVLRPAGRLLIEEPDVDQFGVKLLALGEKLLHFHSHFLSRKGILALFSNAPSARVTLRCEDSMLWLLVEKVTG
ncbi:class I SAM-dependent methyltransferase [bacterium]|nr:MAG: class I SAM-dependent methyltransferase [bacterium]